MFEVNDTFDVLDCRLLEDLGIRSIYFNNIESLNPQKEHPDTIEYKIKAYSIQPLEFFV